MAYDNPSILITLEAAADLSASQFRGVKVTAAQTCNAVSASTDRAIGVLQNKPSAAGRAATIVTEGITKAEAGAAIAAGAVVMFNASGKVITATATNLGHGFALQAAGADGDLISVYFTRLGTQ